MARVFENPANRHTESVGASDSFGVFFFGALYLAYKGLWGHVLIWLVVVVVPAIAFAPFTILTLPVASIAYSVAIHGILAGRYLSKGWIEVTPAEPAASRGRVSPAETLDAVQRATPGISATEGMKLCPYCAEEVKAAATKCKHCQSNLPAVVAPIDTGSRHIKYLDGMYRVGGYHFDKLEQAQRCLDEWVGPKP